MCRTLFPRTYASSGRHPIRLPAPSNRKRKGYAINARLQKCTVGVIAAVGLIFVADSGRASDQMDPAQRTYLRLCGSCHGRDGKGKGDIEKLLTVKPAD